MDRGYDGRGKIEAKEVPVVQAPREPTDFIQAFAFPLPVLVVSEILGFPPEDRDQVRHWTQEVALPFFLALSIDAHEKWALTTAWEHRWPVWRERSLFQRCLSASTRLYWLPINPFTSRW
jgi:cytochrome P450